MVDSSEGRNRGKLSICVEAESEGPFNRDSCWGANLFIWPVIAACN